MKLDYIKRINEYGDNIVRLYDFGQTEAVKFRQIVQLSIIIKKEELDLSSVDFIEARNCNLILRLSDSDEGIVTIDNKTFFCDLTYQAYVKMLALLKPYCLRDTKGYQWLYDIDTSTDFLFSPGGTW